MSPDSFLLRDSTMASISFSEPSRMLFASSSVGGSRQNTALSGMRTSYIASICRRSPMASAN